MNSDESRALSLMARRRDPTLRVILDATLARCGSVKGAAEALDVSLRTVYRWRRVFNIKGRHHVEKDN